MHARTATCFAGGRGRSPLSNDAAYCSAFCRSSSVTLTATSLAGGWALRTCKRLAAEIISPRSLVLAQLRFEPLEGVAVGRRVERVRRVVPAQLRGVRRGVDDVQQCASRNDLVAPPVLEQQAARPREPDVTDRVDARQNSPHLPSQRRRRVGDV